MQSKKMIVSPSHQQKQPQLKCPRCDSSNTKFCYYNNYSLSQPRYFCKACKRYWTRGGTLRNVPLGGSYRKNKRVNRPATTTTTAASAITSSSPNNPHHQFFSSVNQHPLFYGLSDHHVSSCNNLGLGLPHYLTHEHDINGSFISNSTTTKPFLLSGLFGSSVSSASSTLLQHPHKPINNGGEMLGQSHLQTLASLQHVGGNTDDMNKEGKLDQISGNINGMFMSSSSLDPSYYSNIWNNASHVVNGACLDPTNND